MARCANTNTNIMKTNRARRSYGAVSMAAVLVGACGGPNFTTELTATSQDDETTLPSDDPTEQVAVDDISEPTDSMDPELAEPDGATSEPEPIVDPDPAGPPEDPAAPSEGPAAPPPSEPSPTEPPPVEPVAPTPPDMTPPPGEPTDDPNDPTMPSEPAAPPPPTAAEIAAAHIPVIEDSTTVFLDSLADDREEALFPFNRFDRTDLNHHGGSRPGVEVEDLSAPQLHAFNEVLLSVLSQRGFEQAWHVMTMEGDPSDRDELPYYFAVYGEPGDEQWMLNVEGHHLSLNFTFVNAQVSVTPFFLGANPGTANFGQYAGQPVFDQEENAGRELFDSLGFQLRRSALVDEHRPPELFNDLGSTAEPLPATSATFSEMSASSKQLLRDLVEAYVGDLHPNLAEAKLEELEAAGFEDFHFAWMGETEWQEEYYFRVQSSQLLIEMLLKDDDHFHTVWRDFDGDYGIDLMSNP